ncbi:MAG: hypothetical protein ACTSWG_03635 [Candidatus Helarchaeota archaeon]
MPYSRVNSKRRSQDNENRRLLYDSFVREAIQGLLFRTTQDSARPSKFLLERRKSKEIL